MGILSDSMNLRVRIVQVNFDTEERIRFCYIYCYLMDCFILDIKMKLKEVKVFFYLRLLIWVYITLVCIEFHIESLSSFTPYELTPFL